jgi:hypothetical protein
VPDIGQVTRQPAGRDEDGVDADIVARPSVSRCEPLGRDGNPPQPIFIESQRQLFCGSARLDLDKGQALSAAGNEVDFAARYARAPGQDLPAVQTQPPGGQSFRPAAALLGFDAPVQRLSSSARA